MKSSGAISASGVCLFVHGQSRNWLFLCNPKVHHSANKKTPLDATLSQLNLIPTFPSYFFNIVLIISSHINMSV